LEVVVLLGVAAALRDIADKEVFSTFRIVIGLEAVIVLETVIV
jgi:hypothetical protein